MTQANELKYEKLKTDYFKALNVLKNTDKTDPKYRKNQLKEIRAYQRLLKFSVGA